MGTFTKKEIVLFPFPYTDLSGSKLRPCLVISNEMGEDLILCQITSQELEKDTNVISLRKNETLKGTLAIDSYIRCNMLFTASKKQITSGICTISDEKYSQVIENILHIIQQ